MLTAPKPPSRLPEAGLCAIAALGIAWALVVHALGWGQLATYAQVRALADGRAEIDRWHWETKDKAWIDGHFYSVKAPGLALLTLPAYAAVDLLGGERLAAEAVANVRRADVEHWRPDPRPPFSEAGYSAARAARVSSRVEAATPMVWPLTVVGALLPALALLALVRSLANRLEPGYGTAAAITLGLATMVMTFASEYFPHLIAATLGFAAFAILWRERAGPPRPWLAAAAGLLAGLAVCFEYPLGLVGLILFGYVVSRRERRVPRAAGYAAGAVAGALPLFAFNLWAFGSPLTFAYGDAVAVQGTSGHALLGLNDDGVFGISLPSLEAALDLLLASRGLLTLTPIVAIAIAGTVQMRRRGHRAESNVVLAIAAAYFLYNAGYWLPFGGGTPGPRFLIPTLPFLALGLALAWRRWPGATLALAIPSALFMVTASLTYPLIGDIGTAVWAERLAGGDFEHTLLTALGIQESWLGIVPVLAALALAIGFAAAATPPTPLGGARLALALLAAWALLSAVGPSLADDAVTPLQGGRPTLALIGVGGLASLGALAALRRREQRARAAVQPRPVPAPALGERIS